MLIFTLFVNYAHGIEAQKTHLVWKMSSDDLWATVKKLVNFEDRFLEEAEVYVDRNLLLGLLSKKMSAEERSRYLLRVGAYLKNLQRTINASKIHDSEDIVEQCTILLEGMLDEGKQSRATLINITHDLWEKSHEKSKALRVPLPTWLNMSRANSEENIR